MWPAARGFNVQVKSSTSQGSEVLCSYHAVFRSQISIPPYCLYIFFMFVERQLTMSLTCRTHCADAVSHSGQRLYHPISLRSLSHSVGSLSHGHPYYRTALSTANYSAPLTPRTGPDLVPSYITLTFGCKRPSADCRRARIPPPQPRWIVVSPTSTAA